MVRNWHCIEDLEDDKCLVRDMARLGLMSEQIPYLEVFTWDNGTKGVKRAQVCSLLEEAAQSKLGFLLLTQQVTAPESQGCLS